MRTALAAMVPFALTPVAGCREPAAAPDQATIEPAPTSSVPASRAASADPRRWISGDLHMHLAPFDAREGAPLTIADIAEVGRAAGLEFVVVTPHFFPETLAEGARRRRWAAAWSAMAAGARATTALTIIPGGEYTVRGLGHFGVAGADLSRLPADEPLAAARAAGGVVVVNHPFALPTHIPGFPVSEHDLSFRPWTSGRGLAPALDGVEVWNLPLGLANLTSRPGGATGEERAFVAADALARREHRPIAVVGGSDSHRAQMMVTTWVLTVDATERAVLAALRAGATCVGAIDGGSLRAHGDRDPPDHWARIGESTLAAAAVDLRWTGAARLFVDGVDRGVHDGGFVDHGAAGTHTYRIELGRSRCGFVYANLSG